MRIELIFRAIAVCLFLGVAEAESERVFHPGRLFLPQLRTAIASDQERERDRVLDVGRNGSRPRLVLARKIFNCTLVLFDQGRIHPLSFPRSSPDGPLAANLKEKEWSGHS